MKVTVTLEIGDRIQVEQKMTREDFRGDYRAAVTECVSRVELATFGPQRSQDGWMFDEILKMGPLT